MILLLVIVFWGVFLKCCDIYLFFLVVIVKCKIGEYLFIYDIYWFFEWIGVNYFRIFFIVIYMIDLIIKVYNLLIIKILIININEGYWFVVSKVGGESSDLLLY